MKSAISLVSALLSIGLASAATLPAELESHGEFPLSSSPLCSTPSLPLLRAYSPQAIDHFYTNNNGELRNAVQKLGYIAEGTTGFIFSTKQPQTTPLFRLYSSSATDHFYTTNEIEKNNAIRSLGYTNEGTIGFVYTTAICWSVPLYRLYSAQGTDHFYTTSASERDSAARNGYSIEGITGYVVTTQL